MTGCTSATPPPPPPTATVISLLTQPTTVNVEPYSLSPPPRPYLYHQPPLAPLPPPSATAASLPTATLTPYPLPLLPLFLPTPTPTPPTLHAYARRLYSFLTSTTTINIRLARHCLPYPGAVRAGATHRWTGRNDDTSWWQISLADNTGVGWVFGELVAFMAARSILAAAPPPPPTATLTPPRRPRG
ncbi:MAG: hypothetical protein U0401_04270 [Anaerolineae bacterium]